MSLIVKCFWFAVVCVLLGFWLEVHCSGVEWTAANCWPSQVWVCSHPVPGTYSIAVGHWRWSVWVCARVFLYFIAMSLSVPVNGHFSRWTWVSRYQNIFIQNFFGTKDDGDGGDKRVKLQWFLTLPVWVTVALKPGLAGLKSSHKSRLLLILTSSADADNRRDAFSG